MTGAPARRDVVPRPAGIGPGAPARVRMAAVGSEGDPHASPAALAVRGFSDALRLVRDARGPRPPVRVHDGNALGGGDPGPSIAADDEPVRGGAHLDRVEGAPARVRETVTSWLAVRNGTAGTVGEPGMP